MRSVPALHRFYICPPKERGDYERKVPLVRVFVRESQNRAKSVKFRARVFVIVIAEISLCPEAFMNERQKLNFSTVFLYILLFTAMFSLYYVGRNGEPFGLALLYAMLVAGLNPVVSLVRIVGIYALSFARLCGTSRDSLYCILCLCKAQKESRGDSSRLRISVLGALCSLFSFYALQYPLKSPLYVGGNLSKSYSFRAHLSAFGHVYGLA